MTLSDICIERPDVREWSNFSDGISVRSLFDIPKYGNVPHVGRGVFAEVIHAPIPRAGPHQRPHTHVHTRTPYLRSYGLISTKYEIVIHAERSVYRESLSHTPITRGLGPSVPKFLGPCTCAHIVLRSSKQILHDDQTIYIGR